MNGRTFQKKGTVCAKAPRPKKKKPQKNLRYSRNREKANDTITQLMWERGAGVQAGDVAGARSHTVGRLTVRNMDII